MKKRLCLPTLAIIVSIAPAPLFGADLRVGIARYDGGAAVYGLAENQQLICDNCPQAPGLVAALPRPAIRFEPIPEPVTYSEITPAEIEEPESKTAIPRITVYFKFNNARLSTLEKKKIRVALAAGVDPSVVVRVDGYTCRIGSASYNRKLSSRRAKSVASYLKTLGVKVASVEGLGKKHLKGRVHSMDRRAEIVVKERN